jgi:hypothetical protein
MIMEVKTPEPLEISVVHEGRSGFIQIGTYRYTILAEQGGRFTVFFPDGNRHKHLLQHLQLLHAYCDKQTPAWFVENKSRKYRITQGIL